MKNFNLFHNRFKFFVLTLSIPLILLVIFQNCSKNVAVVLETIPQIPVIESPEILKHPESKSGVVSSTVTFHVVAGGSMPLSYQWFKGSTKIAGANEASLIIKHVSEFDTNSYYVMVTNSYGNAQSEKATFNVIAVPKIVVEPVSQTVSEGTAVNFSVVAADNLGLTYQWYNTSGLISGATSSVLSIDAVTVSDSDTFYVTISNSAGSITSQYANLNVVPKPKIPLDILKHPSDIGVVQRSSVTFTVAAAGEPPIAYQWYFNGKIIAGANQPSYSIASALDSDAGVYYVIVSDGNSQKLQSKFANLMIRTPPTIIQQPNSQTRTIGSDTVLTVSADGTAPLYYQWYNGSGAITGANSETYNLKSSTKLGIETYYVVVSNEVGSIQSSQATLTVYSGIGRDFSSVTLLSSGNVLVAGGRGPTSEIFNYLTNSWEMTGSLSLDRSNHSSILLKNGKVLVAGGWSAQYFNTTNITPTEIFDESTGIWSLSGPIFSLQHMGGGHGTFNLLSDGRVLHQSMFQDSISTSGGWGQYAEIFDPLNGAWSRVQERPRVYAATASLNLTNNLILVTGGLGNTVELFDPSTQSWVLTGSLLYSHFSSNQVMNNSGLLTLLQSGNVLVAGGGTSSGSTAIEVFDHQSKTWSDRGNLNVPRRLHTVSTLKNGLVLVVGGTNSTASDRISTCELYDPVTGLSKMTGSLNSARANHKAIVLNDGRVLVLGGNVEGYSTAEVYDPSSEKWSWTGPM